MTQTIDESTFDLTQDPFDTGFEFNADITGNDVEGFFNDRKKFLPSDVENPATLWKATCKAAIKNNWFSAPADWTLESPGKWHPSQLRWLHLWCNHKWEEMIFIPFRLNGSNR